MSSDVVSVCQTYINPSPLWKNKKKKKTEKGKGGWRGYHHKWECGGIVIISLLDSPSNSVFVLLEIHWSRAWQSLSSFSGSQMSPSRPSPLQWTRYWVFFPHCLSSTILSTKNYCCPSIKTGSGRERCTWGKGYHCFLWRIWPQTCGKQGSLLSDLAVSTSVWNAVHQWQWCCTAHRILAWT